MAANLLISLAKSCHQVTSNPLHLTTLILVLAAASAKATVLLLPSTSPELLTFEEEPMTDGWTSTGFKLVNSTNIEDLEVRMLNIPVHGVVALPQLSMTGAKWARLAKDLRVPAFMQVSVEFSVYVSGYQKNLSTSSLFQDNNPDLELTWEQEGGQSLTLANISTLQPEQSWQRYRALVTTGQGSSKEYKLELRAARGGGVLALDDISIDLVPLVGEQYVREEEQSSTVSQEEEGIGPTDVPAINTTVGNQLNATEIQPTPTQGNNPITEKVDDEGNDDGKTTVTGGEQPSSEEEGGQGVESTSASPDDDINSLTSTSRPGSSSSSSRPGSSSPCANNSTDCTESELVGEEKQDTSVYGYTGEVVLICLTVIFAVLFLMMVVKYQRLRTHFGDYQLERTGSPAGVRPPEYDNPAYQVQMSYRQGE